LRNLSANFAFIVQYKQIGNAVPVNLAHAMGKKLIVLLNNIENCIEVTKYEKKKIR
jgi:site-specific DNA-cytosine methylase